MVNIYVRLKTGKTVEFLHKGRQGGEYNNSVSYEGGFVIIEDEWGKETAYPAVDLECVEVIPLPL